MNIKLWWNDIGKGIPKNLEKNLSHCLCPPQKQDGLPWVQTQVSMLGSW
jgi:hypothetical protein